MHFIRCTHTQLLLNTRLPTGGSCLSLIGKETNRDSYRDREGRRYGTKSGTNQTISAACCIINFLWSGLSGRSRQFGEVIIIVLHGRARERACKRVHLVTNVVAHAFVYMQSLRGTAQPAKWRRALGHM